MKNWFLKYALIAAILGVGIAQASDDGYSSSDDNRRESSRNSDGDQYGEQPSNDSGTDSYASSRTDEESPTPVETFDCSSLTKISKCNGNRNCRWTKDKIQNGQYCDCWYSSMGRNEDYSDYSA